MIMARPKKLKEIIIQIDGKEVKAAEGMTVLQAAQSSDIFIPTLCHHEKLSPYGAICIDDTWFEDGEWRGKGTLAAPYLLNKNFWVILSGNRSVLLTVREAEESKVLAVGK